jgi:uncharacterized protein with PQ loop repeat
MDTHHAAMIAGTVSTIIFTTSHVPMLVRAIRTKDLRSYSATNLVLVNLGNAVHWFYIQSLPHGPIYFLHGFYTVVSIVMLFLDVRHHRPWADLEPGSRDLPTHQHIHHRGQA